MLHLEKSIKTVNQLLHLEKSIKTVNQLLHLEKSIKTVATHALGRALGEAHTHQRSMHCITKASLSYIH